MAQSTQQTEGVYTPPGNTTKQPSNLASTFEHLRDMRILIVDDTEHNVHLAKTMLRKSGFSNIVTANNGTEAIHVLQKSIHDDVSDIDLILLDVMMPDMDGYEVCRTIRQHSEWVDIPIIMLTANNMWQDDTAITSLECGASDIMFKPFRRMELVPRVISALSLKRERDLRKSREYELETELAERKIMEARLQYLVSHDDLTGLCNRRRLEQAIELAVIQSNYNKRYSSIFYIDLDQFKVVNDLEGHAAGDRVLILVANTLRKYIRKNDLLARISSDEYVVLASDTDETRALEFAQTLHNTLNGLFFKTEGRTYHIGASIGISLISPGSKCTASEALVRADQACFVAKAHGRNMVHVFNEKDSEMHILRSAAHWVPIIRKALKHDLFRLAFQPVQHVASGKIRHYEALIRMIDDSGNIIGPGDFIPVAERMGLIHEIDRYMVSNVIKTIAGLPNSQSELSLHVNLSGHAFQDPTLYGLIREKIREHKIDPHRLLFEITETAAVANVEQTRDMVVKLRELGCRFALDDFGAGFSSFSYVKQFPVDQLKIDGAFIRNLVNDPVDQSLVKSMIEVGRSLKKEVIAEFVEDQETLDLLTSYGVDYVQGYFIGKPLPLPIADK
ncbi:MAG: GGDEF-domain containing protein [Gammaproteobacteria bacterium]|nr:EAL domain-containing protein [Gammaproteobacteria bacterium]PCH62727.1 MAG: GGDEF-domain containing protein [Gammaproteobacteria bacterium]PCH64172.1 MAG: GGDEF-domain containing protein [Gammaproteobacteria bacterium]